MSNQLLSGYRVLDLTDPMGYHCGRILASLGAEVIKIEPPGGDMWRRLPHQRDSDTQLLWYVCNTAKKSLTLNLISQSGQDLFRRLTAKADVVVESFKPGYLDELCLGYEDLSAINPALIMASITPFGQDGPYRELRGSELVASALGGVLKGIGYPDRAPVKEPGDACIFDACAAAFTAISFALFERGGSNQGQHIDISVQEVAAARNTVCLINWQFDGTPHKRSGDLFSNGSLPPRRFTWKLVDGYICRALDGRLGGGASANPGLSAWMDAEGADNPLKKADWKTTTLFSLDSDLREEIDAAIEAFFRTKTVAEVEAAIEKHQIGGTLVRKPGDAVKDPHLQERGFFQSFRYGQRFLPLPSYFIDAKNTDRPDAVPAPEPGQDNADLLGGLLGLSRGEIEQLEQQGVV